MYTSIGGFASIVAMKVRPCRSTAVARMSNRDDSGGDDADGCCSISLINLVFALVAEPLRALGAVAFASHEQANIAFLA